jgi:hypothetical protein
VSRRTEHQEYLVSAYSDDSHRHAILADDGVTGILYLHAPSENPAKTGEIEATCFAYNRVDPIDPNDVKNYRPNPPPIAKGYASQEAVCRKPELHGWKLRFSAPGTAVLLTRDDEPWAIVSLDTPRGFSKAIEAPGPWGSPWSNEIHRTTAWTGRTRYCT